MDKYVEFINGLTNSSVGDAEHVKISFALAVHDHIKKNNISQVEFARRIGKSAAYISQLLRGDKNLTIESICELARAIGLRAHIRLEDLATCREWLASGNSMRPQGDNVRQMEDYRRLNQTRPKALHETINNQGGGNHDSSQVCAVS